MCIATQPVDVDDIRLAVGILATGDRNQSAHTLTALFFDLEIDPSLASRRGTRTTRTLNIFFVIT